MFSQESSKAISDAYVAVRLTGGNDITPEVKEFMGRYKVRGYPTLYVMNTDGHVVVANVGRTTEKILEALATGDRREAEFAATAGKTDPASLVTRGRMLADRMMWDEAKPLLEGLMEKSPTADAAEALLGLYRATGAIEPAKALLTKSLADFPTSPWRGAWRVRLATFDLDGNPPRSRDEATARMQKGVETLEALLKQVEEEKDAASVPDVRLALGNAFNVQGKTDEASAHYDAALAANPPSRVAASALMGLANARWRKQDYEGCIAQLERILKEHPAADEAQNASAGIENCRRMIAERKAKEEKAKEGGGTDAPK